jgi:exodeoxyribonuclease VII large subunit
MTACAVAVSARRRQALVSAAAQLDLLSPQRTLERGYAIVASERGEIVRDPHQIDAGAALDLTLAKGAVRVVVAGVTPKPAPK